MALQSHLEMFRVIEYSEIYRFLQEAYGNRFDICWSKNGMHYQVHVKPFGPEDTFQPREYAEFLESLQEWKESTTISPYASYGIEEYELYTILCGLCTLGQIEPASYLIHVSW